MGIWSQISGRINTANETLSAASKQWRDEGLTLREDELSKRERDIVRRQKITKARLREIRELEKRRGLRKWLYAFCAIVGAVPAFFLGFALASTSTGNASLSIDNSTSGMSPGPKGVSRQESEPDPKPTRVPYSDPYQALDDGKYGRGDDTDVGRLCLDIEAIGEATFEECIASVAVILARQR